MPEQIGVLAVFLLVVLFNLVVHLLQRRRQTAGGEETPARPPAPPAPPRLPPRVVTAPPRAEAPPPVPVRTAAPPRIPVRRRRRFDLRPGDLRRAVVLMTVLGPCRALEHESQDGAGRL